MPHHKEFGAHVRRLRKSAGVSLPHLSESTGVSKGSLSKLENHGHDLQVSTAIKIAEALNISIEDLLMPLLSRP